MGPSSRSFRAGWTTFQSELGRMMTQSRRRTIIYWSVAIALVGVALGLLVPFDTLVVRIILTAALVLALSGLTAGLCVIVVTREDRRGFGPPDLPWEHRQAAETAKRTGRYDELPEAIQEQMIAKAEHVRKTVPAMTFAGVLASVPMGIAAIVFFLAALPDLQFPFLLIVAAINVGQSIGAIKLLANTNPIIEYRNSRTLHEDT